MTRISSNMTFFYKWIFPVPFFGLLLVISFAAVTDAFTGRGKPVPIEFLFILPLMFAGVFLVMKKLVFDLVDVVWDDGDALIVRNGTAHERIPLANIKNVSYVHMGNGSRVTLTLRQPGKLGPEVAFFPPFHIIPFTKSPIIDALIDRVDAARRHG